MQANTYETSTDTIGAYPFAADYRVPTIIWHVIDGLESCHAATAKTLRSPCLSRYLPSRNRACSLGVDTR